jgi:hypothetical protein
MALTWAGLGAVMGAIVGWEQGGFVGALVSLIVGMIELVPLGAVLSLIGGGPRESLLGGGCGLAVGAVAGLTGVPAGPGLVAAFGLVVGALVGATLRPYLRLVSLPILFLLRVLPGRQPRSAPTSGGSA